MAQSGSTFKLNQPILNRHRAASNHRSFLLPLPYFQSPVRDAYALWLISIISEVWFECNEPSRLAPIDVFVTTLDPSKEPPIVTACLNFVDSTWRLPMPASTEAKDIQKAAVEVAEAFRPVTESESDELWVRDGRTENDFSPKKRVNEEERKKRR
ncbi:hypothetical protein K1719_028919 [Acacia pycnantha]|nr:hypothetical protein K1719_028919 [Acacia pycnantha]